MADIFISYSSQDRDRARKLAEDLEGLGYSIWLDVFDIDAATRWSTEIAEAINACRILLLLLSKASLASENVLKEVSLAGEKKKHILPIVLERTELNPNFEYHLAGLQHTAIENLEAITKALEHFIATHTQTEQKAQQTTQRPDTSNRIAVLPFEDLSPERNNDWFSDGLSDELISNLLKLSKISVVDRVTSRQYKNTKLTLKQIAQELSIEYLITGTVQKSDKRIQINVALLETATGKTLWEDKYRGTMDDIFSIQEHVAFSIAESLKLLLTHEERTNVKQRRTINSDAYELVLRGNSYVSRNTKQDYVHAIALYEQAIRFDPNFAAGYANLGRTYIDLHDRYDRSPSLLEKAEPAIRKALELDPNDAASHYSLGILYVLQGRSEEAIAEGKRAVELAPNDFITHFQLGFIYDGLHQYRNAAEAYERSLAIVPSELDTYYNLILDYDLLQDVARREHASARALPYYEHYLARNPDDQNKRQKHASLLYFVGKREDCFREIEALLAMPGIDPRTYYNCACRYAADGQTQRALELLMKALDTGYVGYDHIMTDPDLASLRSMPEWQWLQGELDRRHKMQTFRTGVTS